MAIFPPEMGQNQQLTLPIRGWHKKIERGKIVTHTNLTLSDWIGCNWENQTWFLMIFWTLIKHNWAVFQKLQLF